ncbi:MAG: inositol monophosphatase [Gammaproteobacteria bacterium]|nr:inositol monophosphatase [Gammaproteobacteria bacterium]
MLEIKEIEDIVKYVSRSVLMLYYQKVQAQNKADGSLITQADIDVMQRIKNQLAESFPQYQFFSEELPEEELNRFFSKNHSGYWCLDPIDGTSNFASGLPYFSISLALIVNGETKMGLIYDPVRDECFTAIKGQGAKLNNKPIIRMPPPETIQGCLAHVDFKRLSTEMSVKLISAPPYRSQRSFGSIALDWCWLAMGRGHITVHGKQMLWDYAAGLLIAEESGCVASTLTGEPIFQESIKSRFVLAGVDNNLYKQWFKILT